eukprot:TRINITY_DN620_c0_g1_i1.p1 TRINITY_DN620_c0_g1~~TRINITY_DN620_c0_g1_i1.p1  ORF type:complete len:268 (-),score=71.31 TRINITY_DN620_c0_g1_i1:247-1050(-)
MGNTSSSRFNSEPTLARTNCVCVWGVGMIMLLTTVIYAGVRGFYAYNHLPAVQINFEPRSSVPFPAVTVCPIEKDISGLTPGECDKETDLQEVDAQCAIKTNVEVAVSGVEFKGCITFNDPANGKHVLSQDSVADELSVQAYVPLDQVQDHLGVLVILHNQGEPPQHDTVRSFWAQVRMATEVYLRLEERHYIDGSVKQFWAAEQIGIVARKDQNATNSMAEIDFQLTKMGVYIANEYYVYNQNNWYGEVGGLASLLFFLHFITVVR